MKTRKELIADFQQQFDQERRRRIWKLSFQLPLWVIANVSLLFAIFGTIYLSIEEHAHFYLLGIILSLFCLMVNYFELGTFFGIFNSIERGEKVRGLLDQTIKKKEECTEKSKSIEAVCDCQIIEIWMKLAIEYHTSNQCEIKELISQEGKNLDEIILHLDSHLEVYELSAEKNFWQYFKSKKWMKKNKST